MARVVMAPGYATKVRNASANHVHKLARAIAADIRKNIRAGKHVITRALVRSVRVRRRKFDTQVYIGTDHWWYIEYGTHPRVMIAGPGEVFRFVKPNGEIVFTKRIRHPGNRAYRVVRRAVFKRRTLHG